MSELVPGILADLPKDPFSPDHKFYIEIPKPHSVGPDQEDQHASLLYDPTNGAVSAGDIFMDQD
ncbi:hypothetical protein HY256_10805 [Candidatus Sumerlaeota bacterium]|nr:hypothetical protein [Candidatus Sumerlaeota bacterium]